MYAFINICQLNATALIRPKRQQEAHKPLDRKALEAVVLDCGDLRLTDLQPCSGRHPVEPLSGKQRVNLHREAHLGIGLCRIWQADIRKYVAGACLDRDALICSSCHSGVPVGDVADLRRFLAALQTLDYRIDAILALLSNL